MLLWKSDDSSSVRLSIVGPILAIGVVTSLLLVNMMTGALRTTVNDYVTPKIPPQSRVYSSEEIPPVVKESKDPRPDVPVPSDALATPDGGYVTALRVDEEGKPLNVEYLTDVKKGTGGDLVPACRGPTAGLYQEGGDWITGSSVQEIGLQVNWKMPTNLATLQGSSVGIYYNPTNFEYPIGSPEYDFFQVDYGVGNNLGAREGWIMTYSYIDGSGERQYPFTTLFGVPETEGATYTVAAMLQPYPYANPSSYVVQVTQGSNSWLRGEPLGYTPQIGLVHDFTSYQDQWLLSSGSSTLTRDTVSIPKIVKITQGQIVYSSSLVTGKSLWDEVNTSDTTYQTRDILSPLDVDVKKFQDVRECPNWN